MRGSMIGLAAAAMVAGVAAVGCGGGSAGMTGTVGAGGEGGTMTGPVMVTSGPYEPLAANASWTFHVNDKGVLYDKTSTVEAQEDTSATPTFRLRDVWPSQQQLTWYKVDGDVVQRVHETALDATGATTKSDDVYDPFRLRVDGTAEHTVAGVTFNNMYTDNHTSPSKPATSQMHNDTWKVDGVDETVTVPAGTFASLHLTHTDSSDGSTKDYWFVRGIGKVREQTSGGHVEELASHTQP